MESIKKEVLASPEKVNRGNFLELAKKDTRGVPQSTGVHTVKLLRGEEGHNKDFMGKEEEGIWLFFEEEGIEKKYFVQKLITDKNNDKYGKFHYLYEKFADIDEGMVLDMEYVKKGLKGYVDVRVSNIVPIINESEIPIIQDDPNGTN